MDSLQPKNSHIANSVEAAQRYHKQYAGSPAEAYVAARGLADVAARFGLGYVGSATPGHERYRGMLALPYLRPAGGPDGVATVRFRCIADACVRAPDGRYWHEHQEKEQHEAHSKYLTVPGDPPRLFNTGALIRPSKILVVVEGEFDAMTWDLAGIAAISIPGTGTWRDYFTPATLGYETVYLIAEDKAGLTCMDSLASEMTNAQVIIMPDVDSNTLYLTEGLDALRGKVGL